MSSSLVVLGTWGFASLPQWQQLPNGHGHGRYLDNQQTIFFNDYKTIRLMCDRMWSAHLGPCFVDNEIIQAIDPREMATMPWQSAIHR